MNTLLASVCYVVLATGATHGDEPVKFEDARRKVEAVIEYFDPALDKSYPYLKPVEPVSEARTQQLVRPMKPAPAPAPAPAHQVEQEPFVSKYNTSKYPPRYARQRSGYRATMEPVQ